MTHPRSEPQLISAVPQQLEAALSQATHVSSAHNPNIKLVKALLTQARQRRKHTQTVLEGVHLLDAALRQGTPIRQLFIADHALTHTEVIELLQRLTSLPAQQPQHTTQHSTQPTVFIVAQPLYQSIRSLGTGVDIMAVIDIPQPALSELDEIHRHGDCLILNDVQDSGNVGTLLRTAAAVGIDTVICTPATAQTWSPKTLRAGMGAQFSLRIYEGIAAKQLLSVVQTPLYATSSHTDRLIYHQDLTQPVAWVMGHEGQGVCDELMTHATPIALPQPNGQESLNVAIAGALCMYEMLRQRCYTIPKK